MRLMASIDSPVRSSPIRSPGAAGHHWRSMRVFAMSVVSASDAVHQLVPGMLQHRWLPGGTEGRSDRRQHQRVERLSLRQRPGADREDVHGVHRQRQRSPADGPVPNCLTTAANLNLGAEPSTRKVLVVIPCGSQVRPNGESMNTFAKVNCNGTVGCLVHLSQVVRDANGAMGSLDWSTAIHSNGDITMSTDTTSTLAQQHQGPLPAGSRTRAPHQQGHADGTTR
jgi:hypothetical protein